MISKSKRRFLFYLLASRFIVNKSFARSFDFVDIKSFGAKCDGLTDDYLAVQAAIDYAHTSGINRVVGCPGVCIVSKPLLLRDDIVFNLNGLHVKPINSGRDRWGSYNNSSAFLLGYWSPAHNGSRKIGSKDDFDRKVSLCPCRRPVAKLDNYVELTDLNWVADLHIGGIYYIRSAEVYIQKSTGVEIEVPIDSSLVKVISIKGVVVHFEESIGFDSETPPLLGRIKKNSVENGIPLHFVQNVEVFGGTVSGRVAFGSNNTGAYKCSMHSFSCDVVHVVQANGFAFCDVHSFEGRFSGRVVETKFCAHNSKVFNFSLKDSFGASSFGMFSVGEGAKNIDVYEFHVDARNFSGGGAHLFQMQYGDSCSFRRGEIFAPSLTSAAIVFYADGSKSVRNCILSELVVTYGSRVCILFSDGLVPPVLNRVESCKFIGSWSSDYISAAFNGGASNVLVNNKFNMPFVAAGSSIQGNVVVNNWLLGE